MVYSPVAYLCAYQTIDGTSPLETNVSLATERILKSCALTTYADRLC